MAFLHLGHLGDLGGGSLLDGELGCWMGPWFDVVELPKDTVFGWEVGTEVPRHQTGMRIAGEPLATHLVKWLLDPRWVLSNYTPQTWIRVSYHH